MDDLGGTEEVREIWTRLSLADPAGGVLVPGGENQTHQGSKDGQGGFREVGSAPITPRPLSLHVDPHVFSGSTLLVLSQCGHSGRVLTTLSHAPMAPPEHVKSEPPSLCL